MFKDKFDFLRNLYSQNRLRTNIWQQTSVFSPQISLYTLIENIMSINLIFAELSMVKQDNPVLVCESGVGLFPCSLSPLVWGFEF